MDIRRDARRSGLEGGLERLTANPRRIETSPSMALVPIIFDGSHAEAGRPTSRRFNAGSN